MAEKFEDYFHAFLDLRQQLAVAQTKLEGYQALFDKKVSTNKTKDFSNVSDLEETMQLNYQLGEVQNEFNLLSDQLREKEQIIIGSLIITGCHFVKFERKEFTNGNNLVVKYLFSLSHGEKRLAIEKINF